MEKVLAFHVEEAAKLKNILSPLRIRMEEVADADFRQSVGNLAGSKRDMTVEPFAGNVPKESLIVFCDLSEKHLNKVLAAIRQKQIPIDYKAVLTPANRKWDVLKLYLEMERERRSLEGSSYK